MNHLELHTTPDDLGDHPELAALDILDSTLDVVRIAIIAAHRELADADPAVAPHDLEELVADHILSATDAMQRHIATYRRVVKLKSRCFKPTLPGLRTAGF